MGEFVGFFCFLFVLPCKLLRPYSYSFKYFFLHFVNYLFCVFCSSAHLFGSNKFVCEQFKRSHRISEIVSESVEGGVCCHRRRRRRRRYYSLFAKGELLINDGVLSLSFTCSERLLNPLYSITDNND